ncbi:glycine oxidase ThiO [Hyphococcus sp. DH-69]|uniref:glycine oxidase ThiO n=1 Tax=Hyphococcus formosus TaxID=3143534 RepID=UPI00398B3DD7
MTVKNFDIAIIGGGVIGLALARALQDSAGSVAVIDAAQEIPPASFAAAGMLSPSFEIAERGAAMAEQLYRFGAYSLSLWADYARGLEDETGLSVDYRADGTLGVAQSNEELDAWKEQAHRVSSMGGNVSLISGEECRALEPALSPNIVGAMLAPSDAQVDPRRLTDALSKTLWGDQVNARITEITKCGDAYRLVTSDGTEYGAGRVVIAGGAISGLVSREMVFPVKGEATALHFAEGTVKRVIRSDGAYLCPKAGGRLVIGASETRGRDDFEIDAAAITALKRNAAALVPVLTDSRELERWSGLRPGTPDGAPILGKDESGCFLALGHYRNGILHTPAATEAMAALILGIEPAAELKAALAAFGPARLAQR